MHLPSRNSNSSKKEELSRREGIVSLVEEVEQEGGDPFSVSVERAVQELRDGYDAEDREILLADSRAIEALSRLVKMQEEWIDGRLMAAISPEAVRRRAKEADVRDLAGALYASQNPSASASSLRAEAVLAGARYWESLRPREKVERPVPRQVEVEGELNPDSFEEDLRAFESSVERKLEGGGRVALQDVLSGERERRVRELYLLAHLATKGLVEVAYDPEADAYFVGRPGPLDEPRSVVLEA